jgi:hypothetical protein
MQNRIKKIAILVGVHGPMLRHLVLLLHCHFRLMMQAIVEGQRHLAPFAGAS